MTAPDRTEPGAGQGDVADLPTRLRAVWDGSTAYDMCHEAAAEIERLTAERDRWRAQAEHTTPGKGRA